MDKKSDGFTLIELIVVVAILGIIAIIAIPRLSGFRSMAEERVCAANRKSVERMYYAFRVKEDFNHEDSMFNQFFVEKFDEVCPASGVISYELEGGKCSVHGNSNEEEEEVPWL